MTEESIIRKFNDRELAALMVHLDGITVPDLNQQSVHNGLCDRLALARFANIQVSQYAALNPKVQDYELTTSMLSYLVSALNKAMSGKLTRAIGAGSPFFKRLSEMEEMTQAPVDRQAAVPSELSDVAVVEKPPEQIETGHA